MSAGPGNDAGVSAQREATVASTPTRSAAAPAGLPRWLRAVGWVVGFFVEPLEVRSAQPADVVGARLLERSRTALKFRRGELGLMQRGERPGGRFVVHEFPSIHSIPMAASFRILRDGDGSRIAGVYRTAYMTWLLVAASAAVFVANLVVTVRVLTEGSQPGMFSVWFVWAGFRALLQLQRSDLRELRAFVAGLAE